MKRAITVLLVLALLLTLVACGGSPEPDNPNCGMYEAATAEMWGIEVPIEEAFEDGFSVELLGKGKCKIAVGADKANGKWTLDGESIHIEGGGVSLDGTIADGFFYAENVLDSGLNITFVRQ